jgi:hypothetical protein
MNPTLLALIEALATAEAADYMTAQAAPANDSAFGRTEHPASDIDREAA